MDALEIVVAVIILGPFAVAALAEVVVLVVGLFALARAVWRGGKEQK